MKVTIMLEDIEDGRVRVRAEFDPPVEMDDDMTPAAVGAVKAIEAIQNNAQRIGNVTVEGEEYDDDEGYDDDN